LLSSKYLQHSPLAVKTGSVFNRPTQALGDMTELNHILILYKKRNFVVLGLAILEIGANVL